MTDVQCVAVKLRTLGVLCDGGVDVLYIAVKLRTLGVL